MRFERRGFGNRRFGGRSGGFGGRDSFGGSDRDMPKPVKVGEEYDVEISEVGSKGDGIARVKNFVVFINGAKQGEKAHIKITDVRNRFAIGEKIEGEKTEKTGETEEVSEGTEEVAAEEQSEENVETSDTETEEESTE